MRAALVALAAAAAVSACSGNPTTGSPGDDDRPSDPGPGPTPCTDDPECDDGSTCTLDRCRHGFCERTEVDDGLSCDDDDACTEGTACAAGLCTGGTSLDCTSVGDECNDGVCDVGLGCVGQPKGSGTPCYAGDPCLEGDHCDAGLCVPGEPKSCAAADSDCTQGVCDSASGDCLAAPIRAGLTCDDGRACSIDETCDDAGRCLGTAPDCSGLTDACNDGVCDEAAGGCVPTPTRAGQSCDDGRACTTSSTCDGGLCSGPSGRDCTGLDDACNVGVCDDDSGGCVRAPANDGNPCSDGLTCTAFDTCDGGACAPGDAPDCVDTDPCTDDLCDEGAGGCAHLPRPHQPGAEGLAVAGSCADGLDNDCDGDSDAADPDCSPCADQAGTGLPSADCDDGDPCTDNLCSATFVCSVTLLSGPGCDDGLACSEADSCDAGICRGAPRDCSAFADDCHEGQCSEAQGGCIAVAAHEADACDDSDACTLASTCQAGSCDGAPRDCSSVADACNGGACDGASGDCVRTPVDDGTVCVFDQCTDNAACVAGACGGGTARDCIDGDACTSDACDPGAGCIGGPIVIATDTALWSSAAALGQACLVAGAQGRLLVAASVRDQYGAPVLGADVDIGGQAATASTTLPGTYYVEIVGGAAPASGSIAVRVRACGQDVTSTQTLALTTAAPNAHSAGTGSCAPADGNLRVRVLDASGVPIVGASVLVGDSETAAFVTDPETALAGGAPTALNTAVTDDSGTVRFFDYGGRLNAPVSVTAGAPGHAYFTVIGSRAADVVLRLPLLDPPATTRSTYSGTAVDTYTNCSTVDVGLVLPTFRLSELSAFRFENLLAPSRCWDSDTGGVIALPGNVWVRDQSVATFLGCIAATAHVNEAPWELPLVDGRQERLGFVFGSIPASSLINLVFQGGDLKDLLPALNFVQLGFTPAETVPTPPIGGRVFDADNPYPNTFRITVSGQPAETDLIGLTLGDYGAADGNGDLFLMGERFVAFGAGNVVDIPNSSLTGASAPTSIGRVALLTAFYLDPEDADRTSPPASDLAEATTSIYVRAGAGAPPFTGSGGTATLSTFLDLSATTFAPPASFRWGNATRNGNAPQFSLHELVVERRLRLPPLSCDANDNEIVNRSRPQWLVMRAFDASCAGDECFTLPTLPPSFPRADSDVQKRSGFVPRSGSNVTCLDDGDCVASLGEHCVAPNGSGELHCLAGGGTSADPYFAEDYVWVLHLVDLEARPGTFSFDDFDFADRLRYMTHESTNEDTSLD